MVQRNTEHIEHLFSKYNLLSYAGTICVHLLHYQLLDPPLKQLANVTQLVKFEVLMTDRHWQKIEQTNSGNGSPLTLQLRLDVDAFTGSGKTDSNEKVLRRLFATKGVRIGLFTRIDMALSLIELVESIECLVHLTTYDTQLMRILPDRLFRLYAMIWRQRRHLKSLFLSVGDNLVHQRWIDSLDLFPCLTDTAIRSYFMSDANNNLLFRKLPTIPASIKVNLRIDSKITANLLIGQRLLCDKANKKPGSIGIRLLHSSLFHCIPHVLSSPHYHTIELSLLPQERNSFGRYLNEAVNLSQTVANIYAPITIALSDCITTLEIHTNVKGVFEAISFSPVYSPNLVSLHISFPLTIYSQKTIIEIANAIAGFSNLRHLDIDISSFGRPTRFVMYWRQTFFDRLPEEVLFCVLKKNESSRYLEFDDFYPLTKALIDIHPGLSTVRDVPEFKQRYMETVIVRIFYMVSRIIKDRIYLQDFRPSKFIQSLFLVDQFEDINKHTEYFSYNHFYVIFLQFHKLDTNHDLFIDARELSEYAEGSLTLQICERILQCPIFKENPQYGPVMSYRNFIWFLLSEVDKANDSGIEYWFNLIDLDGDGILSCYDMATFYLYHKMRMEEEFSLDPPEFQVLFDHFQEFYKPSVENGFKMAELKKSKMAGFLFNCLFNTKKFYKQETQKGDPVFPDGMVDWNNFAEAEYQKAIKEMHGEDESPVTSEDEAINSQSVAEPVRADSDQPTPKQKEDDKDVDPSSLSLFSKEGYIL
eukprot:gene6168-7142_t